ncbi:MAG: hypothetical protein GY811_17720 [Myxococcales bacterium]|nr:hypothetical protein [Myxococcales bacterium]
MTLHPSETSTGADTALSAPRQDPRLLVLLAHHEKLLKQLGRKRRELTRFNDETESARSELARFVAPIGELGYKLDDEIHRLFESILKKYKRSKPIQREIEEFYIELQCFELISQRTISLNQDFGRDGDIHFRDDSEDGPTRPFSQSKHSDAPSEEFSPENHRGRAEDRRNLRSLFIKVAAVLHPDKVQDDAEKIRRTELMQDLNRAYRDGDIARILEIEASLTVASGEPSASTKADEIDRRCRVLESQNTLLSEQYEELLADLRVVRSSMLGEAVIELRRNRRFGMENPYQTIIDPMEESIDSLREMRDHASAFLAGEMELEEFLRGPEDDDEFDDECECVECVAMRENALNELLGLVMGMAGAPTPNTRRASAAKSKKKTRKRAKAARKKNRRK